MSFLQRLKLENQQIEKIDYFQNTCFNCRYWIHKVRKDAKYCHKCINNLDISIKTKVEGYSLEGLRDYFKPADEKSQPIRKNELSSDQV